MSEGAWTRVFGRLLAWAQRHVPKKRRPFATAIFVLLYFSSGGYHRLAAALSSEQEVVKTFLSDPNFWNGLCAAWSLWPQALELVAWIVSAYVFCRCSSLYIRDVMCAPDVHDQLPAFIAQVCEHIGVKKIYPANLGHSVLDQLYAGPINASVASSKRVKMLSIAGFEWLGRGTDSLLHNTLSRRQDIDLECVLLNPDDGAATLQQRVADLQHRDRLITADQIRSDIRSTIAMIRRLNEGRSIPIRAFLCNWHPVFRLLICEEELFVSAYMRRAHGHESPVCMISRLPPNRADADTWYAAYNTFFDSLRDNSKRVI
jgi:hypothetical protein